MGRALQEKKTKSRVAFLVLCTTLRQNKCLGSFALQVQLGQPSSGGAAGGGGGGQAETVFVIQSVFAEEDDERMEFRRSAEGGGFELLSTPYTESPEIKRQVGGKTTVLYCTGLYCRFCCTAIRYSTTQNSAVRQGQL